MAIKIVKARKDHLCDYCCDFIKKGSKYELFKEKQPRYKYYDEIEDYKQVGINYVTARCHIDGECNFDDIEQNNPDIKKVMAQ